LHRSVSMSAPSSASAVAGKKPRTPKVLVARPTPPVPEHVLKAKVVRAKEEKLRVLAHKKLKTKEQKVRRIAFNHAKKYIEEYKAERKNLVAQRRKARSEGSFFAEPEAKVAFVVRIRGILGVAPKPRKIMKLMRLNRINKGVFVKLHGATIPMLKLIEPYVAYGYPSLSTIKQLVYKRGHVKINKSRIPITDNMIIEQHLGRFGIVCVDDIVHELYTAGPNFSKVSRFLWPFTLSNPRGGFRQKRTHFIEGGDAGNRQEFINKLVKRML